MVGLSLGAFGISLAVVQGGLVGTVIKHLGERRTILYGICFNGFAFLFLSIVWSGWVALAFIPLTAIGAVVTPTRQGQMSTLAADDQQGELQGVIGNWFFLTRCAVSTVVRIDGGVCVCLCKGSAGRDVAYVA